VCQSAHQLTAAGHATVGEVARVYQAGDGSMPIELEVLVYSGRSRDLADPDRALERWLLSVAETRLDAGDRPLVREILRQIDGQRNMTDTKDPARGMVGTWKKTTTAACADKYPATLTFSAGTYRGMRAPDQGMVSWDAGIYRLEDERTLVVGTATDELVTYEITLKGDRFEFIDADGCQVTYRRDKPTP
jgi:hypothetical protein